MKILHLDSSALGADSASRALTDALVRALRAASGADEPTYRDLTSPPLSHVDGPLMHILRPQGAEPPQVSSELRAEVDLAEAVLAEFLAADVVVIGAPMYNFSVPSTLKAWIDRIVLPRRTFAYGPNGPQGLVYNKRVIIVSTRGGKLVGQPYEATIDHQEAYLRAILNFIGVTDIMFVRAEGLGFGPEARAASIDAAFRQVAATAVKASQAGAIPQAEAA
jgi:FMN-dependent NADH-azoreductase